MQILNKIQIIVYSINDDRLNWIKKQVNDLKIPIDIKYFKGFCVDDNKGYILDKHPKYGYVELDTQLSCTRTVGAVFNWFVNNCKNKDYLITMEDDVCLIKNGFIDKLLKIIDIYDKNKNDIDYVSIGYLNFDIEEIIKRNTSNNSGLYWNIWKNRKSNQDFDTVWGGQMLLFRSEIVSKLSDIIYHDNTDKIRQKINERIKNGHRYSRRVDVLLGDHFIPLLFKQAVYYPPLGIEGNFKTQMNNNDTSNRLKSWVNYLDLNEYYINN